MRIHSVDNIQVKRPAFKSCCRTYKASSIDNFDEFGRALIQNATHMFREGIDWNALMKYIGLHFADKRIVNTYSLAASDGSEAYSYLIGVLENIKKEQQSKFLNVHACDIDSESIKAFETGRINLLMQEFLHVIQDYNISLSKYFKNPTTSIGIKGDEISNSDIISSYTVPNELRRAIQYKQSDILTELKNMNDEGNSIIMCRNVFPYLEPHYIEKIVRAIKQKIKPGSLFITGNFDANTGIYQSLLRAGFFRPIAKEVNIFERKQY